MVRSTKFLYFSIIAIAIQQGVIALSSFFLVELLNSIFQERIDNTLKYFFYFFMAVGLSYVPWVIANIYMIKNISFGFSETIGRIANERYGGIEIWRNYKIKDKFTSWITKELYLYYEDFSYFAIQASSIIANIFASILALSILINSSITIAYLISIIFAFLIFRFFNSLLESSSNSNQVSRNNLDTSLSGFWDNVLLGNRNYFDSWMVVFNERSKLFSKCMTRKVFIHQSVISLATFSAYVPVVILLYYQIVSNTLDPTFLSTLAILLTRNVSLLNEVNGLIEMRSHFIDLKIRRKNLNSELAMESMLKESSKELISHINQNEIKFSLNGSLLEINFNKLSIPEKGLLTISGNNGAGKTTALLLFKKHLNDRAIFIPQYTNQISLKDNPNEVSTGQLKKIILLHSIKIAQEKNSTLILDEWNANLDSVTFKDFRSKLNELSKTNLVIEAMHFDKEAL